MNQTSSTPKVFGITLLVTLAIGVAALSGCVGPGGVFGEKSPTAVLAVDGSERWTREAFVFNGSASSNPNGAITSWHFDFGDGDSFETEKQSEAENVSHSYDNGGIFNVTLTVTDDGTNQTGKGAATDVVVVTVNEESRIPMRINSATPGDIGGPDKSTAAFDVNKRAVSYDTNLTISSVLAAGTSTVMLRVLDPAGELLQEKEVSVEPGQQATGELDGELTMDGEHTLEIIVTSGSVSTDGLMRIYYE